MHACDAWPSGHQLRGVPLRFLVKLHAAAIDKGIPIASMCSWNERARSIDRSIDEMSHQLCIDRLRPSVSVRSIHPSPLLAACCLWIQGKEEIKLLFCYSATSTRPPHTTLGHASERPIVAGAGTKGMTFCSSFSFSCCYLLPLLYFLTTL
jgi:hypothetical protein